MSDTHVIVDIDQSEAARATIYLERLAILLRIFFRVGAVPSRINQYFIKVHLIAVLRAVFKCQLFAKKTLIYPHESVVWSAGKRVIDHI